jgi:hypothetical protein
MPPDESARIIALADEMSGRLRSDNLALSAPRRSAERLRAEQEMWRPVEAWATHLQIAAGRLCDEVQRIRDLSASRAMDELPEFEAVWTEALATAKSLDDRAQIILRHMFDAGWMAGPRQHGLPLILPYGELEARTWWRQPISLSEARNAVAALPGDPMAART